MKSQCNYCNTEIKYMPSQKSGKYCSNICQMAWQYEYVIKPRILRGEVTNARTLRKYLIETKGNTCNICNCSNVWNNNPLVLQLDHIDGNSDNNDLTNLRLLCPNCHSQTPTYKGGNKKHPKKTKRNENQRNKRNSGQWKM